MGQGIGRVPEAPAVIGGGAAREPIGRYIAQQRRLRGIDLEELSARTRIPRRSLERLEAGAFDRSPDGFSRGFVRTVAEAIGLDADDAVARMLPEPDAAQLGPPRAALWIVGGIVVALVAGAILIVRTRAHAPAAADTAATGLPVRIDYVRALAEANGIHASELSGRDAVLPPPPPEPAEPEVAAAAEVAAPPPKAAAKSASASAPPAATAHPAPATSSTAGAPTAPRASPPSPAASPSPQPGTPASPATELGASPPAPAPSANPSAEATSEPAEPAPASTAADAAASAPPALDEAPPVEAVAPTSTSSPTEPESSPATDAEADD
ncbi:MAG TPA: helix-turn-helix transcriptional regulator [Myxococcota bacterium]|nr:helix-turn-helix transcriptional regulator [Myxococcota bacterium]